MPKHGDETAGDGTGREPSKGWEGFHAFELEAEKAILADDRVIHKASTPRGKRSLAKGRAYLASEIQVGMKVRVIRPIRVESSLGQELLASKRLSITDEEAFLAASAGGASLGSSLSSLGSGAGRGLVWLVTGVEGYVWSVAGFDPAPAYRITFECVGIRRVEEFFANNEVGFASM